jgi:DNA-binding IscR family transcriptional regulator
LEIGGHLDKLSERQPMGITTTKEGAGGGNELERPISQITLLDIFMAIERDSPLFKMHTGIACKDAYIDDLKSRVSICIDKAADSMKDSLKSVTLEKILKGELS